MNNNFNDALQYALVQEMSQYDNLNNPYEKHIFSADFENNIKKIITTSEHTYISVSNKRVRKGLIAILVALFILTATGCAVITHHIITWHESQNDTNGTLDILFEKENGMTSSQATRSPQTPEGFTITSTYEDDGSKLIEYANSKNEEILFSQYKDIENMSVSIDNEASEFKEISIKGYKGYASIEDNLKVLHWTNDNDFFTLQGTCEMSILFKMAESTIPK